MEFHKDVLKLDCKSEIERICEFIRQELRDVKRDGIVVGLSGGIDSALCASRRASSFLQWLGEMRSVAKSWRIASTSSTIPDDRPLRRTSRPNRSMDATVSMAASMLPFSSSRERRSTKADLTETVAKAYVSDP